MTAPEKRIAQLETDLARLQASTAYRQLEAGLVRQRLKATLQIAMNILDRAGDDFERAHDGMTDGLNGGR